MNQLTVQIRDRGVFTLPSELRDKYDIGSGKIYQLVDLEGVFVLVPMIPMAPELAQEIEAIRKESGLSMEELQAGLREQRENIPPRNTKNKRLLLRVFIDSDVLFAGSSFPNIHSASNVILQIDEIVLITVVASEQIIAEVSRNLGEKKPEALPIFKRIVRRCIQVIPDPSSQDVEGLS